MTAKSICLLVSLGSCNCSVVLCSPCSEKEVVLHKQNLEALKLRQAWQFDQEQTEHFMYLGINKHCPQMFPFKARHGGVQSGLLQSLSETLYSTVFGIVALKNFTLGLKVAVLECKYIICVF